MNNYIDRLQELKVIPVIKIDDAKDAVSLGKALTEGGLPCAEITFRTDAAEEAIKNMRESLPDMLIAAGTVLTPSQADRAIAAGADFLVSPGFNPTVVNHCKQKGYTIVPGVCTPSEVEAALEAGLSVLKFFPAEAAGGVSMIKALSGPYGGVRFMPTGGINAKNIANYLSLKNIIACGGTWMVPADDIKNSNFEHIKELTKEAVSAVCQK